MEVAGFDTYWISNQVSYEWDNPISVLLIGQIEEILHECRYITQTNFLDERLVEG